ncbi:Mur ligase domain-containing protein, partial [Sinorhizobium meliloti]
MKITDLAGSNFPELSAQLKGDAATIEIGGITADSRQVKPGDLFVAVAGSKADGAAYI